MSFAKEMVAIGQALSVIENNGTQGLATVLNQCGYLADDILEVSAHVKMRDGHPTLIVGFDYICNEFGDYRTDGEVYITCKNDKWAADFVQVF